MGNKEDKEMERMNLKKVISIATLLMLAVAMISVVPVPAEAQTYKRLCITGGNLYILLGFPEWAYSNGKLIWQFGQYLDARYERNWYGYTQHADNYGNYWGQCVSTCKALSKDNTPTSYWRKGPRVVDGNVPIGTVIATFFGPGGTYSGHCAIFKGYVKDRNGRIIGIEVWDQNWYTVNGMGVFGKHTIYRSGSGVVNADNYYVVLIPSK
jgi:hypothetical protein